MHRRRGMTASRRPRPHDFHDATAVARSRALSGARLGNLIGALALSIVMAGGGYVGGRLHAWTAARESRAQLQIAVQEHQRAFEQAERRHQDELADLRTRLERAPRSVQR